MFEKVLFAGWGDIDFNSHMKNTAYLDKSGDVRMMFFADHGFPMKEFARLRIGPVVMKDEVEYYKEINLLEEIRVTLAIGGLSQDCSRFIIRNEFYRLDGKLAARVTSTGGWMDLSARKLTVPPDGLLNALRSLTATDDYKELGSSIK
ncbi:MAG TPA: thioesterase family protein [Spirochaetota bacterium]|nr:thioesterase family protein [Spirochaetota bacterium]HPS85710.1 thioesterase family protein [Spirochaetota bacterium]